MKKVLTSLFLTALCFNCQAFDKSFVEETDPKMMWYRQIYLEGHISCLDNIIKELEQDPSLISEKIEPMKMHIHTIKWALGH